MYRVVSNECVPIPSKDKYWTKVLVIYVAIGHLGFAVGSYTSN